MITVKDLPRPCFIRYEPRPRDDFQVLVFNNVLETIVTVNPFETFLKDPFLCDTLTSLHTYGAKWSADCKTWRPFGP